MSTPVLIMDTQRKKTLDAGFAAVLEDVGVYKNTSEGRAAFLRFVAFVNCQ